MYCRTVGASVIAQSDGSWELEILVPAHVPEDVRIVNTRPSRVSTTILCAA